MSAEAGEAIDLRRRRALCAPLLVVGARGAMTGAHYTAGGKTPAAAAVCMESSCRLVIILAASAALPQSFSIESRLI
jgi:hypothetical protein